jgi:AcrR family transcriptional regulator
MESTRLVQSQDRRRSILDAALPLFTSKGLAKTSVDDIRMRSGASVGSIYHHFGSKEGVARALYVAAIESYQEELASILRAAPGAASGVREIVVHFLTWVSEHRELAQLMLRAEHSELRSLAESDVRRLNRRMLAEVDAWLARCGDELPDLPRDVFLCALLGPAYRFAQMWVSGRTRTPIDAASRLLADAAAGGLVRTGAA